jgi:hypothetical protein
MRSDEPRATPTDYLVIALSPALVMGLVGSLVFFLLEIFYAGQYQGRMQWILFFFVFGAVLVTRLSMTGGTSGRAGFYGLVLAGLTWVGMKTFVVYPRDSLASDLSPLINLFLVLVVWWCAHRITWDCTQVDDETDVTGQGVLQAAGIEKEPEDKPPEPPPQPAAKRSENWVERFLRYRAERKKRRTLGVWVVWFSLAALPIFGLGQALIPPGEAARRQYTFRLMTVYVACGLGLLLTTCFLGLRRYLRQKKVQMPARMTGTWLTLGGGMIAVLLALGTFLPRPDAEYAVVRLGRLGSEKRDASNWAMKGDGAGKGEGRSGSETKFDPRGAPAKAGAKGGGQQQNEQGKGGGEQGKGEGSNSNSKGEGNSGQGSSGKGNSSDSGKATGEKAEQQGEAGKQGEQGDKSGSREGLEKSSSGGDRREQGKDGGDSKGGGGTNSPPPASGIQSALRGISTVLKWVVFGILAVVVVLFLLRGLLQFLANFTGWAQALLDALRNFWAGLFGGPKRRAEKSGEEGESSEPPEWHAPFSAFPNPFEDGSAGRMSAAELVRYTFAAVQAWARERGMARQPGETALEFVARVGNELPALEDGLRRLVMLYGRAAYARGPLPAGSDEAVRAFWDRLEVVSEQPLSA